MYAVIVGIILIVPYARTFQYCPAELALEEEEDNTNRYINLEPRMKA
jgi:hypothetical protein